MSSEADGTQPGKIDGSIAAALGPALSAEALRRMLDARLDFAGLTEPLDQRLPGSGRLVAGELRDAAVLIPIIQRPGGLNVILTRRPEHFTNHPGQVAFPGGRIDPPDAGPVEAALREADEEIGLAPSLVDVRGVLAPFATGTGFKIYPVVGLVASSFQVRINPDEVTEAFEVPFAFLMNPSNHHQKAGDFRGQTRNYYEILFQGHRIWGVTAHIIVKLHRRLLG
jgi:8-oxo-dGTP pyrophosphatase MutT (NUDIX family)